MKMTQFNNGDTVMVLNGDHSGEFGIVCRSSKEFSVVSIDDIVATFHNSALKLESECVFSAEDLGSESRDSDKLTILPTDAAKRKGIPIYSGCINYFPRTLAAVARRSKLGNGQHNPGKPLHWDRSKSGDELDAMMRHLIDGEWECVAWRALAHCEKMLEQGYEPTE
jgi:hypothetical protein